MFGRTDLPPLQPALPLVSAAPGRPHQVVELTGGRGMCRHLTDMGFVPGAVVTVMGGHGGALIVTVLDSRLMLGRGMAQRIMVRPLT